MSIKTLRKRIALVAVSALGAGLLSVAPASAATTDGLGTANKLTITSTAKNLICKNTTESNVDSAIVPLSSAGVVLTVGTVTAGTGFANISGPGSWTASSGTGTVTYASPTRFTATSVTTADTYTFKPTAVGTISITYGYSAAVGAIDTITITVVESCSINTYAAAKSFAIAIDETEAELSTTNFTTAGRTQANRAFSVDTTDATDVTYLGAGYMSIQLNDTYGDDLTTTGAIVATTTGDAIVNIIDRPGSDAAVASGTTNTAVLASAGVNMVVKVEQDSGAPTVAVVTVSKDGVVVGTRTFTFQGLPASVVVSDVTVGAKSGYGYFRATVKDAAGNALASKTVTADTTYNAAALSVVTEIRDADTAAVTGKTPSVADSPSTSSRYTCTSKGGTAKLQVKVLLSASKGTYLSSAPFDVLCGGASVDTWSISMDKASYAPGEIATLTVSAKDAAGLPVQSLLALGTLEYSFGGMTAVTAPTSTDVFSSAAGAKTYKFSVGTTEGSFVGTFKITGSTDTAAKTVQYKIAAAPTGAVTNAEVLAAIVKLIASINKQIKALQKSLKR